MLKQLRLTTSVVLGTLLLASASQAAVVLEGNFLRVGISDFGTLGSGGSTSPGILHDPTGTQNFGVNDYLTPGTPHEGFAIGGTRATAGGFVTFNNNTGQNDIAGAAPTLGGVVGFDNSATWTGTNGFLTVRNEYYFNDGDQRINIRTTITANEALTDLRFLRSEDPDPDVNTFGSFATTNQRGNSVFDPEDFVGAAGASTGLTIALLNLNGDAFTHDTGIGPGCCNLNDPSIYLTGVPVDNGNGDNSINLAYALGVLASGESIELNYAYIFGENLDTVGGIPEPASFALLGLGAAAFGWMRRRRA